MKIWLTLLMFMSATHLSFAQGSPAATKNSPIPTFELERVSQSNFSSKTLKKNQPVIVIFFSPGCDHCLKQMDEMVKRMKDLKQHQIVMATFQPLEELAVFNKKYQIAQYPNIVTGRDAAYFLPPYFQITNFPYMAFYDRQGKLISTFEGNMSVDNMLAKFTKSR